MDIPDSLREKLRQMEQTADTAAIVAAAKKISEGYRRKEADQKPVICTKETAAAYAFSRMPATCAAFCDVFRRLKSECGEDYASLLDLGAGTGAASFAAGEFHSLRKITCLEREKEMISLGKTLFAAGSGALPGAEWKETDLTGNWKESAELVCAGYLLNEILPEKREQFLKKIWESTEKTLVVIEPGTPDGFLRLADAKKTLADLGAFLVFPCPEGCRCPVGAGDWCAFSCRVARGKLHKLAKGGDAPFEDEKYACAVFSRAMLSRESFPRRGKRIVRHPLFTKGGVTLRVCDGRTLSDLSLGKKDGETYKKARHAEIGDLF